MHGAVVAELIRIQQIASRRIEPQQPFAMPPHIAGARALFGVVHRITVPGRGGRRRLDQDPPGVDLIRMRQLRDQGAIRGSAREPGPMPPDAQAVAQVQRPRQQLPPSLRSRGGLRAPGSGRTLKHLVHLGGDPGALVADIQRRYEAPLREIFE